MRDFALFFRSKQIKRSKGEFWVKGSIGFHCSLHKEGVQVRAVREEPVTTRVQMVLLPEEEMTRQRPRFSAQLVLVTATDDEDLDVGVFGLELRQSAHQHGHAFAWLVETTEEQDGAALARISRHQWRSGELSDIDSTPGICASPK